MTHINKMIYQSAVRSIVLSLLIFASGCSYRTADLTLISTKNIDLSNATFDMNKGRRTEGESCTIALLGLIPLGLPNLEEAVDDALDKGQGNVMVDQVTYRSGYYFILASRTCLDVEGTVLNVNETLQAN